MFSLKRSLLRVYVPNCLRKIVSSFAALFCQNQIQGQSSCFNVRADNKKALQVPAFLNATLPSSSNMHMLIIHALNSFEIRHLVAYVLRTQRIPYPVLCIVPNRLSGSTNTNSPFGGNCPPPDKIEGIALFGPHNLAFSSGMALTK